MKNIKWSNFLKEAGVLLIVITMILSTMVVTANINMNKNTLTPYNTASNIVQKTSTPNMMSLPTTQFNHYGGLNWHDGDLSCIPHETMCSFKEPTNPHQTSNMILQQTTLAKHKSGHGSRGTIYVDDDAAPGWYDATHVKTIQEGINNASTGDTVFVYDGTYNENVIVGIALSLVGENKANVIVNGNGFGSIFQIFATFVNVTGFTFAGGGSSWGDSGIITYAENTRITDCNSFNNQYGIYISYVPNTTLRNNTIYDNTYNFMIDTWQTSQYYQDIDSSNTINGKPMYYLINESNLEVQDFGYLGLIDCNNVTARDANCYGILMINTMGSSISNVSSHNNINGVYLSYSSNNEFTNCDFSHNRDIGVYADNSPNNTFSNCESHDNTIGIGLSYSPNCSLINCSVYLNSWDGLIISRSANNLLTSINIHDNFYNLVIFSENPDDYIQDIGLSNTVDGKPIDYLVGQSNLEVSGTNVGFLGLVSCTNVTASNLDLEGCVIVNTVQSTIRDIYAHQNEYGILLVAASNNDITNCTVADNHFGIYLFGSSANTIENSEVYNNTLPPQMSGWQGSGIDIESASTNNIITNVDCHDNTWGIYFNNSPENNILSSSSHDNEEDGIYLGDSPNSILRHDTLHNNGLGLGTSEEGVGAFYQDIDTSNTINGKPIAYLVEQSNVIVHDFGYLGLISCKNVTAKNAEIYGSMIANTTDSTIANVSCYNTIKGIFIIQSTNNSLIDSDFSSNSQCGIFLTEVSNQKILNCVTSNNAWWGVAGFTAPNVNITNCKIYNQSESGIYLYASPNSTITNCNIYNNSINGIYLSAGWQCPAFNNQIIKCLLYNNFYGVYLTGGWVSILEHNTIMKNTMFQNAYGIYIDAGSNNNTLHLNNFIDNQQNAFDVNDNHWDSENKGNYWSDYSDTDANGDGIGDTPYNISGGSNQDRYPLMTPFPRTEITVIKGGLFRISATIQNTGITNASINWSITLEKGFILLGKHTTGTLTIPVGQEATLKSKILFGFGKTTITVQTDDTEKTATGRIFLFFALGVK
jgi:parallel beta-helix repeat protein